MGHRPWRPQHLEYMDIAIKVTASGNSLVVQWLGLGAFNAVTQVGSLVGELRSRKPRCAARKKKKVTASTSFSLSVQVSKIGPA